MTWAYLLAVIFFITSDYYSSDNYEPRNVTMAGNFISFKLSKGPYRKQSCVCVYLLEWFRVGLSGVVGHVRDVGLVEVRV